MPEPNGGATGHDQDRPRGKRGGTSGWRPAPQPVDAGDQSPPSETEAVGNPTAMQGRRDIPRRREAFRRVLGQATHDDPLPIPVELRDMLAW